MTTSSFYPEDWPSRELHPAEEELVRICRAMRADEQQYFAHLKVMTQQVWWEQTLAEHPTTQYVPRFVEFERRHHGTHAGLMAARQVLFKARDFMYEPGDVRQLGRRQILSALGDYAAAPELPNMLHYLVDGRPDPVCETFLRQLVSDAKAGEQNRACAGYLFGRWCVAVDCRQWIEDYLHDPDTDTRPLLPKERAFFGQWLVAVPSAEKLAALTAEAADRLELLSNCPAELKEAGVINVRNEGAIVEFSAELTERHPAIRDLAAGLLFKMRHLNVGSAAPDLELDLIDGRRWSLAEHAGKVVVIQFAHSGCFGRIGCGPRVEAQPVFRQLVDEYGERVEVLSIMSDYSRENMIKVVEWWKLPWSIHYDGVPGPIAMKWGVTHVPTDYVVAPNGMIAGRHLRGERLKARVAKLLRGGNIAQSTTA